MLMSASVYVSTSGNWLAGSSQQASISCGSGKFSPVACNLCVPSAPSCCVTGQKPLPTAQCCGYLPAGSVNML